MRTRSTDERKSKPERAEKFAHLHQLLEAFAGVRGGDLLAQNQVQQSAERPGERRRQHHHRFRDVNGLGADGQPVPGADRLRADLADDDDAEGGDDDGHDAGGHVVQQDGEYAVDQHVAQQNAAQQVVAVDAHRVDGLRVPPLRVGARVRDDLQVGPVQRQQSQVQSGEQRREAQADDDDDELRPQRDESFFDFDAAMFGLAHAIVFVFFGFVGAEVQRG